MNNMDDMDEIYVYSSEDLSFIPDERRKEIDAILKKSAEDLKKNGLEGFLTFEEFKAHMEETLRGIDHV